MRNVVDVLNDNNVRYKITYVEPYGMYINGTYRFLDKNEKLNLLDDIIIQITENKNEHDGIGITHNVKIVNESFEHKNVFMYSNELQCFIDKGFGTTKNLKKDSIGRVVSVIEVFNISTRTYEVVYVIQDLDGDCSCFSKEGIEKIEDIKRPKEGQMVKVRENLKFGNLYGSMNMSYTLLDYFKKNNYILKVKHITENRFADNELLYFIGNVEEGEYYAITQEMVERVLD